MSKRVLQTKDILNKKFKQTFRGFDIDEVDEFLDIIMRDYDSFQKDIAYLQAENERLLAKVDELSRQALASKSIRPAATQTGVTNFDILKRLTNLENRVFGEKLEEPEDLDKTRIMNSLD